MVSRLRAAAASDGGFTLIEMVVSLIVFALVAQALAGVLISSSTAQLFTQMNTTAKNLAQQRVDAMRSLPYHVDAQNGPFVDLLDLYFHDASGTPNEHIYNIAGGGDWVAGQYVSGGGGGGPITATYTGPTGPYYQITILGSQLGPKYAAFTQVIYTQFLDPSNPAATSLPASKILNTYDTTSAGNDLAPSPLVGVTIVTTWHNSGTAHALGTFTEITGTGTDSVLVVNQAKAAALQILTQDPTSNALTALIGSVGVTGSVSHTSTASAQAVGASITPVGATAISGALGTAVSPPQIPAGSTGSSTATARSLGCLWAAFAKTQISDVSATVASGLPKAPSDATAYPTTSPVVAASVKSNASGTCGGKSFAFGNNVNPATNATSATDPALGLDSSRPMVVLPDLGGTNPEVTGMAQLYTTATNGSPGAVTATASSSMVAGEWLELFPGLSLSGSSLPNPPAGNYPPASDAGLVNVQLTSATLSCTSAGGGATTATLTYNGTIAWYTLSGGWQSRTFAWTSGPDPFGPAGANVDLTATEPGGKTLGTYIAALSGATGATLSSGVQNVEAAVTITTAPTIANAAGSALHIELGHLSCVAA